MLKRIELSNGKVMYTLEWMQNVDDYFCGDKGK